MHPSDIPTQTGHFDLVISGHSRYEDLHCWIIGIYKLYSMATSVLQYSSTRGRHHSGDVFHSLLPVDSGMISVSADFYDPGTSFWFLPPSSTRLSQFRSVCEDFEPSFYLGNFHESCQVIYCTIFRRYQQHYLPHVLQRYENGSLGFESRALSTRTAYPGCEKNRCGNRPLQSWVKQLSTFYLNWSCLNPIPQPIPLSYQSWLLHCLTPARFQSRLRITEQALDDTDRPPLYTRITRINLRRTL
ncbi:hypothetical protein EV421DRAFT_1502663 [Armillaria borealis]|uniref:Uncharacterized protein n=1 Tax=Armillaria borealis TaxID=47425 RepID=A0AA39IXX3_9AGAR|nr:hypothetical protein EV421DRAFT_533940 [Armillaria borealis]KAK0432473.1 hypothetical protein EV421DRAFT_1502663 [Armillaria borealis]